jgi:glycosyltransferase involved in cell wall biosynthesis
VISICIPGYNRPDYLAWTLDKLEEDFPEAEIIVSDDCSTQDMSSVRYDKRVRWIQQPKNLGAFPNLRTVLLEARGDYAVYCGNDDYLLPERLSQITAWMDSHPEVSAYIAPCEIWDEVNGKSFWPAFKSEERTFYGNVSVEQENIRETLSLREANEREWATLLPGMSREFYARLAYYSPADAGPKEKGQLQELRRRVLQAGKTEEEAMRDLWGAELTNAPFRLRSALESDLAVSSLSPKAACGPIELFNFIIERHVWPEHIVYRTPVPYKPFTRAFWCFASLPDLLAKGAIHFDPVPFYRNLLIHPVGERVQLGNVQCLTFFDEYRAGLEVLAYGLFGEQPYAARHRIQEMISSFICQRMYNAAVLYHRAGDTESSEMLLKRIKVADPSRDKPAEQVA